MVRTQIQLTEQQAAALRKRAAQERVSMAELVRRSVTALLEEEGEGSDSERKRKAIAATGFLGSGPTDLAREHDAALSEAYRA